jgi:predicted nuclease of predicted toxin-antitoxin system
MQRAVDRLVVERARSDQRVLLTFDLDFGAILALGVMDRPSVIIFRLADERSDSVNRRAETLIADVRGWLKKNRPDLM